MHFLPKKMYHQYMSRLKIEDTRKMRPLIWAGVLLWFHVCNAWFPCPVQPSIKHCANRSVYQSRTDIHNCVKRMPLCQQDYRDISCCFERIPHNLETSMKETLEEQCVHELEMAIKNRSRDERLRPKVSWHDIHKFASFSL